MCTDPVRGEVGGDASCGKMILVGEVVITVASMIERSESSEEC